MSNLPVKLPPTLQILQQIEMEKVPGIPDQ